MTNEPKKKEAAGEIELRQSTGGVFENVDRLAQAIKSLGERFSLVTPGGAIGTDLPQLYAAGISFVFIDPIHETYPIAGRSELGIGKNALDRIAAAAGVRWNPHLCGRLDDGSNPYFVEYQAAGTVLQLDGTERMIQASKRVDLRAEPGTDPSTWGADAREIARIAAKANPPREPWPQILQARQHILSLAETKAKNRAIRTLGVRTSYAPEEINRGFAVVRLQFTGHSDDPEVEREVSMMIARRALGASASLYGSAPAERTLSARTVPKIVAVEEPDEDEDIRPDPAAEPAAAAAPAATEPKPKAEAPPACPKDNPALICGAQIDGKWPRKPCSEFTVDELRKKIAATEKNRPNWDPKWAARNEAELTSVKAWLAFKELDPRQGVMNLDQAAGASDKVPF